MLCGDVDEMNEYMNLVAEQVFSNFDTGKSPSQRHPERFYHGFVLGLIVELSEKYLITSNRESGFCRYDVMIEPKNKDDDAIILEFKVFNAKKEKTLEETVQAALSQIEEKKYESKLLVRGFRKEQIRKYGFAFEVCCSRHFRSKLYAKNVTSENIKGDWRMSNFFDDTMQGLLEAIAIKNGEIEMEEVLTYEDYNIITRSCRRVSETQRIAKKQQEAQKKF